MTRCAFPAQHKGHCCQGRGKDKAVPRTQKGWTFRKRHWTKLEGINKDLKKQLHVRKEGIFKETLELEIAKRIARSSVRIRKMSVRTLWRGRPPLKQKEATSGLRARDVGALTTLGTFACTDQRKMVINLD
jgi:hypothetical protein